MRMISFEEVRAPLVTALLALICLVPFNFMPYAVIPVGKINVPIGWFVFFPAGAILFCLSAWTFLEERRCPPLVGGTILISFSLLLSSFVAEFRGMAISTTAGFVFRSVAISWAAFFIGRQPVERERFIRWLALLGALTAAGALYEPLTGHWFLFHRDITPQQNSYELWAPTLGIASGAIGQPLPLSALLNLFLPFSLWYWARHRRWWTWLALILMIGAILATYRRTGYAIGVAIVFGMTWATDRRAIREILLGLLVIAAAAAAIPSVRRHVRERFNSNATLQEISVGHRRLVYDTALDIVSHHPLIGIGTRQYEKTWSRYATYAGAINTPDSQYLRTAIENGVIGLAILAGFIGYLLLSLWRHREEEGLPFLVACAGFSVGLVFLDGLYWPATSMTFFAIAGAGLGRVEQRKG